MYKVFINDRSIVLTDSFDDYKSEYDTIFIQYQSEDAFFQLLDLLKSSPLLKSIVVFCPDLEQVWNIFNARFPTIEAAGGVVKNNDQLLFIYKNNHWDLPKGKIDKGESIENSAIREVKEECGLKELSIEKQLETTYYLYKDSNQMVLKKTNWFLMNSSETGPLKGDEKEGITEVKWLGKDDWESDNFITYPSVMNTITSLF